MAAAMGCGGETSSSTPDADEDFAAPGDVAGEVAVDTAEPDAGPQPPDDTPGAIRVGVGRVRMPIPLGIGTAGYAPFVPEDGVKSRYAPGFPSTTGIYTHPTLHSVAVEGASQTVVFLRVDAIGISQQIRSAVVAEIIERGGPDLSQGLLVGATHTHSGPGRLVNHVLFEAGFDEFFPAFYERMTVAGADSVMAALADLEPARFGHAMAYTDALHSDRRCESPENEDGTLPIMRFDRADGTVKALVMSYAAHGTIVDIDKRLLSRDFHGGIELKIEERFDAPVTALFFNSWSGDAAPSGGSVEQDRGLPSDFNQIEAAGNTAADLVFEAVGDIETTDAIAVRAAMTHLVFDIEAMGYEGEFVHEYGAAYCGIGLDVPCFGEGDPPPPQSLTTACLAFPEPLPAPQRTAVGMTRLGDLWIATLPAEVSTELGTAATAAIAQSHGLENVALIGYAQDYVGYHTSETDWYRGGYEASGAIWGPKQGDFVNRHLIEFAEHFVTGEPLAWEASESLPAYDLGDTSFEAEPSAVPASIIDGPAAAYTTGEVVRVSFAGGDAWLLAPLVRVEQLQEDGSFAPLLRKNGLPLDSDGYEMTLSLSMTPGVEDDPGPVARTFEWTVELPTLRGAPTTTAPLTGATWRLSITGLIAGAEPYTLLTEPFTVD